VGKTESVRQLGVSRPCLKFEGGVRHRGNREETETRKKKAGSKKEALDSSVSPSLCLNCG
jgi:hypothetical protein